MNVAVKTLNQSVLSPVILSWPISFKHQLVVWTLILTVLFSAFGLIYIKDVNRRLMGNLQMSQRTNRNLHTQWSQLLLEKSTWAVRTRVEKFAEQKLDMVVPSANSIVLVKSE